MISRGRHVTLGDSRPARERVRIWPPLAILIAVGAALRLATMLLYKPAVVYFWDSAIYLYSARHGLFDDPARSAGYPLFLRAVHAVSNQFAVTIGLQHVMGLVAGLLLYGTVRKLGGSRWVALVPAAVVVLNGDLIVLEHSLLTESLFVFLVAVALYCAAAGVADERPRARLAWLVGAGLAIGVSATVRPFAACLAVLAALFVLVVVRGGWRPRVGNAAALLATTLLCVVGYAAAQAHFTGDFGLSRTDGWALYARVGSFADCSRFTPPAGTEQLCEASDPDTRGTGPRFYFWDAGSPARKAFGAPPAGNAELAKFARAALEAQPGDYVDRVAKESWRYVEPMSMPAEGGPGDYSITGHSAGPERAILNTISVWYAGSWAAVDTHEAVLDDYQGIGRVHGLLVLIGTLVALVGVILARGRTRLDVLFLFSVAMALYLVPVITLTFNWRYGVPAAGVLAAAAALGAQGSWARFRRPAA